MRYSHDVLHDRPVFDVSLVAGHRDRFGARSNFSAAFVRRIAREAHHISRDYPALRPTAAGRLHFTLRAVYGDRDPRFPKTVPLSVRQRRFDQIQRWLQKEASRKVVWQGYALTPEGILVLYGKAVGSWLTQLRRQIDRTSDRRSPYAPSGYCHIVLARPKRRLRQDEISGIRRRWLTGRTFSPIPMTISRPVLVATRNHFGTKYL